MRGYDLTVDLRGAAACSDGQGFEAEFAMDDYRREMLLQGLDEIGRTLLEEDRDRGLRAARAPRGGARHDAVTRSPYCPATASAPR